MNLYDAIFKRKSVRKYLAEPLDNETLEQIMQFAGSLKPLIPSIQTAYEVADGVKNIMPVKAPHYFIISSEKKDGWLENAGFLWEQMDLYLSNKGLGTCWLGMAKPQREPQTALPYVIALAFGKPKDSPYRNFGEFNRKPLVSISCGQDARLETVRLAPSASNSQNWFFDAHDGMIDIYMKRLNPVMALAYAKFNRVDMGIALCFLYYATQQAGGDFDFTIETGREKSGYAYIGTVH